MWDHLGWLYGLTSILASALHWWGPEGRNSTVCSYIYIYIYFVFLFFCFFVFCVSLIKHFRLNRTGVCSDKHSPHARLSQVDPCLHDFSTVCFSRFSLPLINQRSKFEFQMLKTFLFHILHVTQSRISMGLTVSRKSVENPAIRRKNRQIGTLFFPPTMGY